MDDCHPDYLVGLCSQCLWCLKRAGLRWNDRLRPFEAVSSVKSQQFVLLLKFCLYHLGLCFFSPPQPQQCIENTSRPWSI